jgi:hypothetical protein
MSLPARTSKLTILSAVSLSVFLAEETGSNFLSGLASKLKEILQELDELKKSVGKKSKGINRHLDSHTEHLKLICPKVDVKFKPLSNSDAEA